MKLTAITNSNLLLKGILSFVLCSCLIFSSCEGPEGSEGPVGPTGAAGTNGLPGQAGANGQNYTSSLFTFESSIVIPSEFSTTGSNVVPLVTNIAHYNSFTADYNENKVKSGAITHSQVSKLILNSRSYPAQTIVSFVASIDSEVSYDYLLWLIDGQIVNGISGSGGPMSYKFLVPPGTHTLEWRYVKNDSFSNGEDAALIDDILIEKWSTTASASTGRLINPALPETMNYWNDRPNNLSK